MLNEHEALSPFIKTEDDFKTGRTGFVCFDDDEDSRNAEAEYLVNPPRNDFDDFDYSELSGEELRNLERQQLELEMEDLDEETIEMAIADREFQEQLTLNDDHPFFANVLKEKQNQNKTLEANIGRQIPPKGIVHKPDSCVMTKAKPLTIYDDVIFTIENGFTFATFEGEKTLLFEGILSITERKILITEVYAANGKVIDYSVEARFKVSLDVDGAIYQHEVDVESFDDGKFLSQMSLGEVALEKSSNVKKLFAKFSKKLRREKSYANVTVFETPGWKNYNSSTGWYYALPTGVVGNPSARITVENNRQFGVYTKYSGNCIAADFLSMREIFREHKENGIVCQYYLLLSILKGLLREKNLNPQFLLAIIGETNSKKTTLATLFFKLYEREGGPDIDFTATKVALEEATAANADAVTIYDDITPPNTRAGELDLKAKVETLTRTFGGNLPRKRSKLFCQTNAGVSEFTPVLGQGVMTGEVFPITLKSSRARILKLEFKGSDCDDRVLSYHQQHLEYLPEFVIDFIAFVSANQGWLLDSFSETFDAERIRNSYSLVVPRFRETYAMFAAIVRTFGFYLGATGVYSNENIQALMASDLSAIGTVIKSNDNECNQRPDEVIIAECILDTKFVQESGFRGINPLEVIYEEEGLLAVHPQAIITILKKYFQQVGKIYPYSTQTELHKFLNDKDLIKTVIEGDKFRYTLKGKGGRRYLKFYKAKLSALVE